MGIGDVYFAGEDAFRVIGFGEDFTLGVNDDGMAVVGCRGWRGVVATAIAHEYECLIFDRASEAEGAALELTRGGPACAQCEDLWGWF